MTGSGLPEDPIGGRASPSDRGEYLPRWFRSSGTHYRGSLWGDAAQPLLAEHLTDPRKEP